MEIQAGWGVFGLGNPGGRGGHSDPGNPGGKGGQKPCHPSGGRGWIFSGITQWKKERICTSIIQHNNLQQFHLSFEWPDFKISYTPKSNRTCFEINNIVNFRCAMDADCWQEHAVNVTLDSMEGALNWIWDLKTTVPRSSTATVEGILKGLADQHVSIFELF